MTFRTMALTGMALAALLVAPLPMAMPALAAMGVANGALGGTEITAPGGGANLANPTMRPDTDPVIGAPTDTTGSVGAEATPRGYEEDIGINSATAPDDEDRFSGAVPSRHLAPDDIE